MDNECQGKLNTIDVTRAGTWINIVDKRGATNLKQTSSDKVTG